MSHQPVPNEACTGVLMFVSAGWAVANHVFKWLTLLAVFWAGLSAVSVFNLVFLMFFCVFFIWPQLALRFWTTLIVYTELVILGIYFFMVLSHAGLVEVPVFLRGCRVFGNICVANVA